MARAMVSAPAVVAPDREGGGEAMPTEGSGLTVFTPLGAAYVRSKLIRLERRLEPS